MKQSVITISITNQSNTTKLGQNTNRRYMFVRLNPVLKQNSALSFNLQSQKNIEMLQMK